MTGTFAAGTTVFTGSGPQTIPLLSYQNVGVTGTAAFSGTTTITGGLTVSGSGRLVLGPHSVTVTGDLRTQDTGTLDMTAGGSVLDVSGAAVFGGGSTTGLLTAGTLKVKGNFSQLSTNSSTSFVATGTHLTLFQGDSRTMTFASPGASLSRFRGLTFDPPTSDTLTLGSDIHVEDLTVSDATSTGHVELNGSHRIVVSDSITLDGFGNWTAALRPLHVVAGGAIKLGGSYIFAPDTTEFAGGVGQVIPDTADYKHVVVTGDSVLFKFGPVIDSSLIVRGTGLVDVADASVAIGGDLRTEGSGRLAMTGADGSLSVSGDATFGGGSTAGLLTEGTLSIAGDVSQSGAATALAASGNHVVRLTSSTSQTLFFTNPGAAASRFARLIIDPATGDTVTINSDVYVEDFLISDDASLGAEHVEIRGAHSLVVGDTLHVDGFGGLTARVATRRAVVNGTLRLGDLSSSVFSPDTAEFAAAGQVIPFYGQYQSIVVSGDSARFEFFGTFTLSGSLIARGSGYVRIDSATVDIGQHLETQNSARLVMRQGGDVTVRGNVTFSGGSTAGSLEGGTLTVANNFTQTSATSPSSFAPSSGFSTTLNDSSGAQVIRFADATNSYFRHLTLNQSAGGTGLDLQTDVTVRGTFTADGVGAFRQTVTGNGYALRVGGLAVDTTDFDHTLLTFADTGAFVGTYTRFQSVRFLNYDSTETQFYIRHKGLTGSAFMTMGDLTFNTVPQRFVGYYVKAEDADGLPDQLKVDLGWITPSSVPEPCDVNLEDKFATKDVTIFYACS